MTAPYDEPSTPLDYLADAMHDFAMEQPSAPEGLKMIIMLTGPEDDEGKGNACTAMFGYDGPQDALKDLLLHMRAAGRGIGFDVMAMQKDGGYPSQN